MRKEPNNILWPTHKRKAAQRKRNKNDGINIEQQSHQKLKNAKLPARYDNKG